MSNAEVTRRTVMPTADPAETMRSPFCAADICSCRDGEAPEIFDAGSNEGLPRRETRDFWVNAHD